MNYNEEWRKTLKHLSSKTDDGRAVTWTLQKDGSLHMTIKAGHRPGVIASTFDPAQASVIIGHLVNALKTQ